MNTELQYQEVVEQCNKLFIDKMSDYGAAWRIMRLPSLTDQIFIKANRIRNIQIKATHKINENIDSEFIGIINYSVMAIIQLREGVANEPDLEIEKANELYKNVTKDSYELMMCKNHDYDEAWRKMRVSSITDIILMKLLRIKEIENNNGKTLVSEGLDANYFDIINYAIFAMIILNEENDNN